MLERLKSLNELGRGVDKRWIYIDCLHQELAHDYLQKINYSIQDINYLIGVSSKIENRIDVISLVVMVNWIADSVWQYKSCLTKGLMDSFLFSNYGDLKKHHDYIRAIRSIVVAHPLNTDSHKDLGLDGDIICVDLRKSQPVLLASRNNVRRFGVDGIEPYTSERSDDIYLYVYSKKAKAQCFEFLVVDLVDVVHVAHVYIDQLYEIDKYLSKLKKKDHVAK